MITIRATVPKPPDFEQFYIVEGAKITAGTPIVHHGSPAVYRSIEEVLYEVAMSLVAPWDRGVKVPSGDNRRARITLEWVEVTDG